jgi:diacylglycerol kinase (ATP)
MAPVHILGNPSASRGRRARVIGQVAERVTLAGLEPVIVTAASRADALAGARRVVAEGADRLVVVGGDGLVHLALQAVATTGVTLGIVPAGTGNDFARAVGLAGLGPETAADRALGDPAPFDAVLTTHGWFASVASIGFSAAVNARANRLRWPKGSGRYTVATLLELPRLGPITLGLELDRVHHEVEVSFVALANTRYFGGGMRICPDASPHDGRLDVAVIGPAGRLSLLRVFPSVFAGTHVRDPRVTMLSGRCITITGPAGVDLWADGELVGPLPLEMTVVADALRLAGAGAGL